MDGGTQSSSDVTDFSEVNSIPLDLDDLFDVQKELIPVSAKWRSIGIALRLKPNVLDGIEARYSGDPPACLTSMVTEWLNRNYNVKRFGEPTWQALVRAVSDPAGGANMAHARDMATRHKIGVSQMPVFTLTQQIPPRPQGGTEAQMASPPLSVTNHPSLPQPSLELAVVQRVTHSPPRLLTQAAFDRRDLSSVFARENRQAIMDKFADFQTKVCDKLFRNGVDTEQVRLFVTSQFPPGDCIPPPPAGLTEVFKAITQNGLWDYFHYSPLVRIVKAFGGDDHELEGWVQTYKQDLKAYSIVTSVEEYIETDLEIARPPSAKRARYDPCYYTPVEWKTKFVDHSLQYLADVWELFSSHYLVPDSPPTALLERIRRGCFSVTWLVPSGLIPQLIKLAKIDTEFFQQHRILKVTVGDECVYEDINEEGTLEAELAQQKEAPPSNTPLGAEEGAEPHDRPQQKTFGGYNCEFVEPPPSVFQTECPICSLILRDPYHSKCCGTNFCHTCSERIQDDHKPCPTCREDNFELFANTSLKRSITQLHVLCTHSKDGCMWRGELGELENHLSEVVHSDSAGLHSPTPSSLKLEKKRATALSAASEAFRKCSADLLRGIQDPELLAWELYSDEVIPQTVMDEVSMVGLSAVQRKTRLLSAVRDQIAVDPAKFQILLQVLRKQLPLKAKLHNLLRTLKRQPSLKNVAEKLKTAYESQLEVDSRETELKDVAEKLKTAYVSHLEVDGRETELKATTAQPQEPVDTVKTVRILSTELQGQAWYHGWISQETAEERLNKVPYNCFLIRENDQKACSLSLSIKDQGGISHFLIERYHNKYTIPGTQKSFAILLHLVDFFMTSSILGNPHHRLSSPCPRPSPDNVRQSSGKVPPHLPDSKFLLLHLHSKLRWRRMADLPVAMSEHHIVRIGSTIYCGGGYTGNIETARQVFQYNPKQDIWSQLPICSTVHFGLTQLNGKLVTVGGEHYDQTDIPINDVYVFQESETWENSIIPPLPTARFYPTAINYKSTLVVTGGLTHWHTDSKLRTRTNAVEVFNTKTFQWHQAEALPVGHSSISCVIVDDTCYLIGGTKTDGYVSRQAYCTSVSNLISRALPPDHSETSSTQQASPLPPTWQVLPECPLYYSTAAELGGCLLAIGGMDDSNSSSSAVHMYSFSTNLWVRISRGDLPVPRSYAAATQLEEGEAIFVGGDIKLNCPPTKTVFIVSVEQ